VQLALWVSQIYFWQPFVAAAQRLSATPTLAALMPYNSAPPSKAQQRRIWSLMYRYSAPRVSTRNLSQ
jgi:hypothetical protein